MASLLKSLSVSRQAESWTWSLRESSTKNNNTQQDINLKRIGDNAPRPLRRLNLCCNMMGDEGFRALLDVVKEEVGLLALDLQEIRITESSGIDALAALKENQEILIFDIRNNSLSQELDLKISEFLSRNKQLKDQKGWVRSE
jgi:hypothetical protein